MRKSFIIKFDFGEPVVLRTDPEVKRVVSGYLIRQKSILYGLARGEDESWHQDVEIERAGMPFKVRGFGK